MKVHNKALMGPYNQVPCPWCGVKLDLTHEWSGLLETLGFDTQIDQVARQDGLKVGSDRPTMTCEQFFLDERTGQKKDIGCGRSIIIQRVDRRPRIVVRQDHQGLQRKP